MQKAQFLGFRFPRKCTGTSPLFSPTCGGNQWGKWRHVAAGVCGMTCMRDKLLQKPIMSHIQDKI